MKRFGLGKEKHRDRRFDHQAYFCPISKIAGLICISARGLFVSVLTAAMILWSQYPHLAKE